MRFILLFLAGWVLLTNKVLAGHFYYDYEDYDKVIRVNTYANKLTYYENWEKIWKMNISSGDTENYTPRWRFVILNKSELMYSRSAWRFMPYWLDFWQGLYWIHSLPQDSRGDIDTTAVIWENANAWCVRLQKEKAKKLYERADIGTYVLVDYDKNQFADKEEDEQVIRDYFSYINQWKHSKAFDIRINRNYSLNTFKNIYTWVEVKIKDIENINWWEFYVQSDLYHNWKFIGDAKSSFSISNWKIVRSYVIR